MPTRKSPARGAVKNKLRTGQTLKDLLINKLSALSDVENQLIKALPKMAKNASDPDLRHGFEKHLEQTKDHAQRIAKAFDILEVRAQKLTVDAIRGMIADAEWVIKNVKGAAALDANLIAAAQYVEHYEAAGYESAVEWANLLGQEEVASLLRQTLEEEQETSAEFAELASSKIDERALPPEGDTDADENER
jgi:ferritin-like metal-binding protein YciE